MSVGSDLFESGMGYVALSRVTTLNGLFLLSFCPQKIKPSQKVIEEYARLKDLYEKQ